MYISLDGSISTTIATSNILTTDTGNTPNVDIFFTLGVIGGLWVVCKGLFSTCSSKREAFEQKLIQQSYLYKNSKDGQFSLNQNDEKDVYNQIDKYFANTREIPESILNNELLT